MILGEVKRRYIVGLLSLCVHPRASFCFIGGAIKIESYSLLRLLGKIRLTSFAGCGDVARSDKFTGPDCLAFAESGVFGIVWIFIGAHMVDIVA